MDEKEKLEIKELIKKENDGAVVKKEDRNLEDLSTEEIVDNLHKQAIVDVVKNDVQVQEALMGNAKNSIINEFESKEQETIDKRQKATYNANEEACKNYGIDKAVPLWQIRMMKFGSSVWFVIYFIVASVTIAPVNVFFKGIKSFIKQTWLAIIFAIFMYLVITVGIPLIVKFVR